jgi:hypothetical protein
MGSSTAKSRSYEEVDWDLRAAVRRRPGSEVIHIREIAREIATLRGNQAAGLLAADVGPRLRTIVMTRMQGNIRVPKTAHTAVQELS